MPQPKCLITGCRLVVPSGGKHVWGDLHQCGSALVFNACLEEGEAAWEYGEPFADGRVEKRVSIPPSFPYFERRGVIVFDKYNALFNEQALLYLRGTP